MITKGFQCLSCQSDKIKIKWYTYPIPNPDQRYDTTVLTLKYKTYIMIECIDCGYMECNNVNKQEKNND